MRGEQVNIQVLPKTEAGTTALRKSIEDNKKQMATYTLAQQREFTNIWKEIIIENPLRYTLILRAHSALGSSYYITKSFSKSVNSAKEFNQDIDLKFQEMVDEIDKAMQENGATREDYTIEVNK